MNFASKFIQTVAMSFVPGETKQIPLLACGGVDTMIHLFIQVNDSVKMILSSPSPTDFSFHEDYSFESLFLCKAIRNGFEV